MTNQAAQPPQRMRQCQPYGTVSPGVDEVILDVVTQAVTRLVELLERRPSLFGELGDASSPGRPRRGALAALLADPDVRAACTVHLSVEDAVELATEIIDAATPEPSPGRARSAVSGSTHDKTTDHTRKATR